MGKEQITTDIKTIQIALEHALTYPRKAHMGEGPYHEAHAELQRAQQALTRLNRTLVSNSPENVMSSASRLKRGSPRNSV